MRHGVNNSKTIDQATAEAVGLNAMVIPARSKK
jgi:hypothetical protein